MTTSDWIIDIALILIVLRQVREARIDRRFVLIPAGIVAWVAHSYLHDIPTTGNDVALIAVFVAVGLALGIAGGLTTRVRAENGVAYVKAGLVPAGLWVLSMSGRLAFILWITHSAGEAALARFSVAHQITGQNAWTVALVLMALGEVISRVGILLVRGRIAVNREQANRPQVLVAA